MIYTEKDELEDIMLRIDELDSLIIAHLTENGRASYATLGKRVGLSTPAVKRRVDRLVAEGVIQGFTVTLDPGALGWTIEAFVEIYCEGQIPPDEMRVMVGSIPEVVEAFTVTGDSDGIMLVRAADASHFETVLGTIRRYPGVLRTRSAIVLSRM